MKLPDMHLCLVSDQPVPSLAPLLDRTFQGQGIVLLATPERNDHARWLGAALRDVRMESQVRQLRDGYSLTALREDMAALAPAYPQGVTLNLTGGTKLMTIAAWETFNRPQDKAFYVQVRDDSINWLRPEDRVHQPIVDSMRLDTFLAAHGYRVSVDAPIRRGHIDSPAYEAHRRLAASIASGRHSPITGQGYWLEEFVFETLRRLRNGDRKIQDLGHSFKLHAEDDRALVNELDVAVLRSDRLSLIECKTGVAGQGGNATQALYKLGLLARNLGGMRRQAIFVTTAPAGEGLRARARDEGILLVDGSELGRLPECLEQCLQH